MATSDSLERIIRLDVNANPALAQIAKLAKATQSVDSSMQSMTKGMQAGIDRIKNVAGVLTAAFASFKGLQAVTEAGDKIRNLTGSFEALLGSADRAADMMGEVFAVVKSTGADMDSVANSMQRLSVALADAGGTNAQIAQIAENFIKLGRIGGSSMEDATGALIQFTQGLASGKLAGDELKSIMERVPLVGKQIAAELGVSVGKLKEMGAEGKITADVAFKALLKGTEQISEQFAKMPVTMSQAFNQMSAVGTQMLANFDKVSGISTTIAIAFGAITDMLESINGGLVDANDETDAWSQVAIAVGNAFRGILIVINTIVGAVRGVVTGMGGLTEIVAKAVGALTKPLGGGWKDVKQSAAELAKSMEQVWESTTATNKALALGEQTTKTATRTQRDYQKQMDAVAKSLKAMNTETEKTKAPKDDDWTKWVKSLIEAVNAMELMPKQLAYLDKTLAAMAATGDTTSAKFVVLTKEADKLRAALDPLAAAVQKYTEAAKEQAMAPAVFEEVGKKLEAMAAAGKMVTLEFQALAEVYAKLKAERDPTGAVRVVQELQKAEVEASTLQAKFDAINQALEEGSIKNEAAAQKMKDSLVGVSDAADKAKDSSKSLSQSIAEAGAKFVTDFSDKVIDSLGDIETSFGDLVESMLKQIAKLMLNSYFQKFIKALEGAQGTEGFWGALAGAISGKAKGAAYDAHGAEFFAKGGVVTQPTMFAHGGGLGVMGERGAEAIVPLQRNAAGDLGVSASPVTVNINNNADVEVTETHRDNTDGSRIIDVTIERKVRAMFAGGSMDRTMRSTYGVTRQPSMG